MIFQPHSIGIRRAGIAGLAAVAIVTASFVTATMSPDLRLVTAAKAGDRKAIAALLKEKVDVNASTPGGATALA